MAILLQVLLNTVLTTDNIVKLIYLVLSCKLVADPSMNVWWKNLLFSIKTVMKILVLFRLIYRAVFLSFFVPGENPEPPLTKRPDKMDFFWMLWDLLWAAFRVSKLLNDVWMIGTGARFLAGDHCFQCLAVKYWQGKKIRRVGLHVQSRNNEPFRWSCAQALEPFRGRRFLVQGGLEKCKLMFYVRLEYLLQC